MSKTKATKDEVVKEEVVKEEVKQPTKEELEVRAANEATAKALKEMQEVKETLAAKEEELKKEKAKDSNPELITALAALTAKVQLLEGEAEKAAKNEAEKRMVFTASLPVVAPTKGTTHRMENPLGITVVTQY